MYRLLYIFFISLIKMKVKLIDEASFVKMQNITVHVLVFFITCLARHVSGKQMDRLYTF